MLYEVITAVFKAVADAELGDRRGELFGEALGERVVNARLHVEAVGAHAGLPGIALLRGERAGHRGLDVGIVEHDERRVAAQFHRDLLHGRGALPDQDFPDLGGAGEGEP